MRNPANAGIGEFGKVQVLQQSSGLNRRARLEGRCTLRASKTVDRPREEWIEIPVPAMVTAGTSERSAQWLADNKRYASRNNNVPSLLQGLAACPACGSCQIVPASVACGFVVRSASAPRWWRRAGRSGSQEGQDRQHPAVIVRGAREVQLGEDVPDVALDRLRR
jgi:hypothetical protein